MSIVYRLFFDDDVYADLAKEGYDAVRWAKMLRGLGESTEKPRSKKNFEELCRRGVLLIGDTLTMRTTVGPGVTVALSATIGEWNSHSIPWMRTSANADNFLWLCRGPTDMVTAMEHTYSNLNISSRGMWDIIFVTRNNEQLGTLHELRQYLELWDDEMKK